MASPPNDGEASSPSKADASSEIFDPFGLGDTSFHAMENYLQDDKKPAADDEELEYTVTKASTAAHETGGCAKEGLSTK